MGPILLVAILIGLLVLAGVVLAIRFGLRDAPAAAAGPATTPRQGSDAAIWLRRGERAADTLRSQVAQTRGQAVAGQLADVSTTNDTVLADLRRVGGQVRSVEDGLFRIDVPRLRAQPSDPTGSVAQQLAVADRLGGVRDGLLDRMQSTVIGMEGLSAQLAEVVAMAATAGGVDRTADRVAQLSDQLEGLRYGLQETEQITQGTLQALPPGSTGQPPAP